MTTHNVGGDFERVGVDFRGLPDAATDAEL